MFHTHTYIYIYIYTCSAQSIWITLLRTFCSAPRLRSHISSYLDVPGLCAERATARENYSRKASAALCWASRLWIIQQRPRLLLLSLCNLLDLTRLSLRSESVTVGNWNEETLAKKQFVARPDVLLTAGDIYVENEDQIPQLEQALARDSFQVFAGLQGATILDTQMSAGISCPNHLNEFRHI